MKVLEAIGGRKFILVVLCVLLVVFTVPAGAVEKLDFLKWLLGIYVAGNVVQKATQKEQPV